MKEGEFNAEGAEPRGEQGAEAGEMNRRAGGLWMWVKNNIHYYNMDVNRDYGTDRMQWFLDLLEDYRKLQG